MRLTGKLLILLLCAVALFAQSQPVLNPPNPIPSGTRGSFYTHTFTATGGTPPYTFSQPPGATAPPPPPASLTLAPTGVLSGTITAAAGPYAFPVRVTDSLGAFSDTLVLMTVVNPVTIITASPLPQATVSRGYNQSISATGGDGSYLWSTVTPATDPNCPGPLNGLPPGISLGTSEAASASVGFEASQSGTFTFCVQADDNAGTVGRKQFVLVVNPLPSITTMSLPNGTVGINYNQTLAATGGTTPLSFTIPPLSLPAGLTLTSAGVISGMPTTPGTSNFTVTLTDAYGATATRPLSITILATPSIISVNPNSGQQGTNNLNVTIAGQFTNWVQGSTTVNLGPGITVNSVTVSSQPAQAAFISQVLGNNPRGFWILNDVPGSPATAVDSSVNAFNGTYLAGVTPQGIAGPSWVAPSGLVANFAGGTISFPTPLNLGSNGYTIQAWVNPSLLSLTQATRFVASGSGFNGYGFGTNSSGRLIFTSFSRHDYVTTGLTLLPNQWQYVGVVLDASNTAHFYVNGSFVESVAGLLSTTAPTGNFTIGNQSPGAGHTDEIFTGGLAGISVYDTALTLAQIQAQYNAATATSLTANISIAANAAVGARNLTVTTGSEIVNLANAFTVTAGTPVIIGVNPNIGPQGTNNLNVAIAGVFTNWVQGSTTVNLGPGITVNSVTVSNTANLTANISIAANAALGARNLTVTTGSEVVNLTSAFTVTAGTPAITSVNPNTGQQGTNNLSVAIAGLFTNWVQGSTTVNLGAGITVNLVTVNSATSLTANISIAASATVGLRNLTVTTGSEIVNLANAFTVTAGTPVITSVNPNTGQQGINNLNVAIAGQFTNWVQGSTTVNLGAGIAVNSVTVSSATSLTANISIAANATVGLRNLTVTTGSEIVNLANAFTVTAGTPVITSVNPNTGQQGTNNLNVAITALFTNWAQGATAVDLGAGITVNSVAVSSATSLTANVSIATNAVLGARNLTVTTNGEDVVSVANAFTVTAATPVITNVNPNTGQQGTNNLNVAITGSFTNWSPTATQVNLGAEIAVNSVTVNSATSLIANISIASNATVGARNLTVTTGGEVVSLANAFTVTAGTPVITSVNPNNGQQGANSLNVAIGGQFTNWAQGSTTVNLGAGITVNSVTVGSATSLTANISIAANAAAGIRNLTVTTGNEVVNLVNALNVTPGTPAIISVNPNTGQQGTNNLNVAIAAVFTNWLQGSTTVDLGAGITVNSVTVGGATSLTANISIAANAAVGARNLTVVRDLGEGTELVSLPNGFTVTAATPVITSVNPNTGQQGTNTLNVAIAGQFTNWVQGSTTVNLGVGITVNSVTVSGATTLTANISVAANAAAGARNLTVTTGAEVVNLANAFTVTPGTPVITNVNPNTGQQGTNNLNVAIAGQYTNWVQGSTTVNLGAGITVNSVTVSSSTSLTANISIAANAAAGARNLTVTTGAEIVNLANAFTVTAGTPVITSVNPNTGQQGANNLNVAIAGQFTNWVQGSTTVNLGAGITVNSVTVSSATSLTANISIAANAAAGGRNLTVTTGAETVNLANAFTVTAATLVITTSALPTGAAGVLYSAQLAAAGGAPPYSWSISAGALPTGLSLNPSTGVISGTPMTAGAPNFTVRVDDTNEGSATRVLSITISAASLVITNPPTLPNGTAGQPYTVSFTVSGGTPPYNWSLTGGSLPSGLSLSSAGVLSGTPAQTGTFNFTATVTDSPILPIAPFTGENGKLKASGSASFSLTIGSGLQITTTALPNATAGVPYSVTLAATGGVPPYTWSIQSGSLPPGLSMSSAGVITGTPSVSSPVQFEAKVTDSVGSTVTRNFSVSVNAPQLNLTTESIPNGTVGVAYSASFNATGGLPPYSWSLQNSEVPGLSLNGNELKGTPTVAGTYSVNVLVTDQEGTATGKQFKIVVASPKLEITTTSLPNGVVGSSYSSSVSASGGLLPYVWGSAGLPGGLSMNTSGAISGTPAAPGTFSVSVTVTDGEKNSATKDFSIRIVAPLEITTPSSIPPGTVASPYSLTLAAAGGVPPLTWSGSGTFGLSVTTAGVITGTPTTAGRGEIEVTVTDADNRTSTKQLSIEVFAALVFVTESLPRGTVGVLYGTSVSAAGGRPPYRFSGSGPEGLSIDANGFISGTPRSPGASSFSVEVTDAGNVVTKRTYPITIVDPLTVTTASLPGGVLGTPYTASLGASGGRPPLSWSVLVGSLPAGLSVSQDGTISGTPTAPGMSTFTVTVTDADNTTASRQLSITINAPPVSGGSVSGVPANPQPQTQLSLNVVLPSTYPLDVTVTLALTFASEVGGDDQTIQFSTGGRTATLVIPAGQTQAASAVGLQTGTVAGTITILVSMSAGGMNVTPQPQPRATIVIPRGVPVLTSLQIQRTGTGLNLTAIGYTVTRSATQAVLTLEPSPGSNLQTTSITVDVSAGFATHFATAGSNATGGQFRLVLPLTINGDQTAIRSISMTLANTSGASQPVSALVP